MSLFLYEGNAKVTGPHSKSSLMARLAAGELGPGTLAAPKGTDDWQPLGDALGYRPAKPAPEPARKPVAQPPPLATPSPKIERPTDVDQLRQVTAYPFIRLLANLIGVFGVLAGIVILIYALAVSGDEVSIMMVGVAIGSVINALLWREGLHLAADIADRLHQAARHHGR